MQHAWRALALGAICLSGSAFAGSSQPVTIEIVAPDGRTFREFPVDSRDGAVRSYLEAEKGAPPIQLELSRDGFVAERISVATDVSREMVIPLAATPREAKPKPPKPTSPDLKPLEL